MPKVTVQVPVVMRTSMRKLRRRRKLRLERRLRRRKRNVVKKRKSSMLRKKDAKRDKLLGRMDRIFMNLDLMSQRRRQLLLKILALIKSFLKLMRSLEKARLSEASYCLDSQRLKIISRN
jgi:hypothetical protein